MGFLRFKIGLGEMDRVHPHAVVNTAYLSGQPSMGELQDAGLSDREIAVLSLIFYDRMTTREASERLHLSQTQIMRLKDSGVAKMVAAGWKVPDLSVGRSPKTRNMDPMKMDRIFTDADRYNAQ